MIFIGIDFSISSPAVCINDDNKFSYYSLYRPGKLTKKEVIGIDVLKEFKNLSLNINKPIVESKNYQLRETNNLIEAEFLTDSIIEYIQSKIKDSEVKIGLEGFSYGSTGNRLAELAGYNYLLRHKLIKNNYNFSIYSPKTIKAVAGNGNYNKDQIAESYLNIIDDDELRIFLNDNKDTLFINRKYLKPIDDLIDAYFTMKTVEKYNLC